MHLLPHVNKQQGSGKGDDTLLVNLIVRTWLEQFFTRMTRDSNRVSMKCIIRSRRSLYDLLVRIRCDHVASMIAADRDSSS